MVDQARAVRLAARIHEIVAEAVGREVKDPRLEGVTFTGASVSGDLGEATITYTLRGDAAEDDVAEALSRAKGTFRRIVGAETGIKFTPDLTFERERGSEAAEALEELLTRARAADEAVRAAAKDATPAGEADPYRRR